MYGPQVTEHMSGLVLTGNQIPPTITTLFEDEYGLSTGLSQQIASHVQSHFYRRLAQPPAWVEWVLEGSAHPYDDEMSEFEYFDLNPGPLVFDVPGLVRITIRKLPSGKYLLYVVPDPADSSLEADLAAEHNLPRRLTGLSVTYPLDVFEGWEVKLNLTPLTGDLTRLGFVLQGSDQELTPESFDAALRAAWAGQPIIHLANTGYPWLHVQLALLGCRTVTVTPANARITHFTRSGPHFTAPVVEVDGKLAKPTLAFLVSWPRVMPFRDRCDANLRAVATLLTKI